MAVNWPKMSLCFNPKPNTTLYPAWHSRMLSPSRIPLRKSDFFCFCFSLCVVEKVAFLALLSLLNLYSRNVKKSLICYWLQFHSFVLMDLYLFYDFTKILMEPREDKEISMLVNQPSIPEQPCTIFKSIYWLLYFPSYIYVFIYIHFPYIYLIYYTCVYVSIYIYM